MTTAAEERAADRACRLGWRCACQHTACRAGWLDHERTYARHGARYVAAVRCPACWHSWRRHVGAE